MVAREYCILDGVELYVPDYPDQGESYKEVATNGISEEESTGRQTDSTAYDAWDGSPVTASGT